MWITAAVMALSALIGPEPSDLARLAIYRHQESVPEARVWLDQGIDPVLQRGNRVRVYYRSSVSAYVAILQIDTDGTVRLRYPRSPTENHYARADRDYRLLFPRSPYWHVDDRPGVGYFFIVTSPRPFDFSDFGYSYYQGGWDLSLVGNRVYKDPYMAIDDFVARLVPDWEYAAYGLDFTSYRVGAAHAYPRFLCYDCHGFKPYDAWNPYHYTCTNFRVVVYDDPYFYPSRRYRGDRVVFAGGSMPRGPRFGFKERARGEPGTLIVQRAPAEGRHDGSAASNRQRRRAIPRGVASAPDTRRPTTAGPRELTSGDRDPRVRAPTTRQGASAGGEGSPGSRRARPAPDAKRPVLERRRPVPSRPSDRARSTPTPRSAPSARRPLPRTAPALGTPSARSAPRPRPAVRRPLPRKAPTVRKPPLRSGGSAAARSGATRPRPAVQKRPPRRPGGASSGGSRRPPRPRRPGG